MLAAINTVAPYGIFFPTDGRPKADPVPLLAMLSALCLTRWVIGARITPLSGVLAAFGGAVWAYWSGVSGPVTPSIVGIVVLVSMRKARAIRRRDLTA